MKIPIEQTHFIPAESSKNASMPPQLHFLYLLDTVVAYYLHFLINYNSFPSQFRIFSLPVKYTDWKPSCRHYVQPHTSLCCLSLCSCYIHIIKFNRDINLIIRLLFQSGQKNNRLHMFCKWEVIYRNNLLYLIML